MKKIIIPTIIFIFAVLMAGSVSATTTSPSNIYVSPTGNDTNDGLTPETAVQTINVGIDKVAENGQVNLAAGIYNKTGETSKDVNITISKNLTIAGAGKDKTIIDALGASQIFEITYDSDLTVFIKDITFQNGKLDNSGGAISSDGTLTVQNCIFKNNTAVGDCGGALFTHTTLNVVDCIFTGNVADAGGAIFNKGGSTTVTGSTFDNNAAIGDFKDGGGAAIYNYGGTLNVTGSIFTDNNATTSDSGTIYNGGGILNVTNSTFTGNEGGAIVNEMFGALNVTNSKFTGNHVIYDGGAIWNYGNLTVTGSTFTGNIADGNGGAIYTYGGDLTVNFCRIAGNTANGDGNAIYNNARIEEASVENNEESEQLLNAENNWWGSNHPDFATLISGMENPNKWIYMAIKADPTTINNGETSQITVSFNNLFDGTTVTPLNPADGHLPDGTPVTFNTDKGSIGCKTIEKQTSNGIATATLTADETAGTAHVNAVTDSQTMYVDVTINPKSSLYLTVTPSKANPVVGDAVIYTLKVGNNGPDTAKDVVMTYTIPEGLEFNGAKVDVGEWKYDASTRTITWIIGDVPVGDPYMWITLHIAQAGHFSIYPLISTSTYDPTLSSDTQSLTVNAAAQVKAASKTIPLQKTGMPLAGLVLAILAVFGGLIAPRRR